MKLTITAGLLLSTLLTTSGIAQDWYHDRESRYQGDQWRPQVFLQVRNDLDHVYSARDAANRERARLDRTKQELSKLQTDLDAGRYDNKILNDVIDSLAKSANDQRLAPRDREVISDDRERLKDYQNNHSNWKR